MTDYHFASTSLDVLTEFAQPYMDVLGPVRGRASVPSHVDENGVSVMEQPAIGDPNKFYCCIRSAEVVVPPEGIEAVDPAIGTAIYGVWA